MELNKIYNMDCIAGFKMLKDGEVDVVITSPPYNRKRNDKYSNYDDILRDEDYRRLLHTVIEESMRVSRSYVFFNIQKNYYNREIVYELFAKYSKYLVETIVWGKTNPMPASGASITNSYEFIFVFSSKKPSLKSNNTYTKNLIMTNVYSKNPYKKIHKAVMNPEVAEFLIENFTQEGDIIIDPFAGVGTTAYVSKQKKRSYLGFEINKEYCNIANSRLRD